MAKDPILLFACLCWAFLVGWIAAILWKLSLILGVFVTGNPLMELFQFMVVALSINGLYLAGALVIEHLIIDRRILRRRKDEQIQHS
mgnify:CR=1 FL=1